MTGNIGLDVVIGLVFIYLIYSLYATVIMEIVTSIFGLRAKNLSYALRRMLMDEKQFKGKPSTVNLFWFWLKKSIAKIWRKSANLENPEIFKKFNSQPLLKYLSDGGILNKPSYITHENFSKALIDTLKSDSSSSESLDKIKDGIASLPFGSDTKKHLISLFEDATDNVEDATDNVKDAAMGLSKFKVLLEQWFNDTMERSTGWFKRRVQFILFIIGIALAVSFNANTLEIIKKLSKDPEARQQLVDMAINYSKENKETIAYIDSLKKSLKNKDTINRSAEKDSILLKKIDTLLSISNSLKNDIYKAQNIISSNWRISDKLKFHIPDSIKTIRNSSIIDKLLKDTTLVSKKILKDSLVFAHKVEILEKNKEKKDTIILFAVHQSIDPAILKKIIPKEIPRKSIANGISIKQYKYKWRYVFATDGFLNFKHLWGYILTALAISLGSPFWFDLLNKLIKLRSSVTQSESKKSDNPASNENK